MTTHRLWGGCRYNALLLLSSAIGCALYLAGRQVGLIPPGVPWFAVYLLPTSCIGFLIVFGSMILIARLRSPD